MMFEKSRNWNEATLGEVSKFSQGIQVGLKLQKTEPRKGFVRFIRIIDYTQQTDDLRYVEDPGEKYLVSKDDLVMVRYGTPGLIGRGIEGVIANNLFKITLHSGNLLNDYVEYFLSQSHIQKFLSSQGSSTMPALTFKQLKTVKIVIPPLDEQQRIVRILDEAFENISVVLEQSIKELNDSTSLFESLLDRTFGQTTKDENGAIVPLWPTQILSDVCEKITDGAHKSPQKLYDETSPGLHPYLTSKNIRMGHLKLDTLQYCNSEFHNKIYARCNPEPGDVLLTKDGANTGNVTINSLNTPFSLLSSVCLIKTKTTKLLPNFLYYYIRSRHGFNQLTGKMTGTAIKRIILKTIKASEIPLPSIVEQKKTIEFLDRHCEEIEKLTSIYTSKVNFLNEMKQSILKEALNGNLTMEITA